MVANSALGAVRPSDVVLSPDGSRIYVAGADGFIRVYGAESGALIHEWDVGTNLGGMDISPDGSFLIVTEALPLSSFYGEGGNWTRNRFTVTNYKVSTATGQVTSFPYGVTEYTYVPYDVAIQPNNTVLITHSVLPGWSASANMRSLNLNTGQTSTLNIRVSQDSVMSRSESSSRVLLTESNVSDAPLRLFDNGMIVANHHLYQDNVIGNNEGVHAYSDAGGLVAHHVENQGIVVYNESLQLLIKLSTTTDRWTQSSVSGLAFNSSGSYLYILDNVANAIVQLSTATWTIVQEIPVGVDFASDNNYSEGQYGNRLLVGPNSRYFTVVTDTGLRLVVNPSVSATISGTGSAETLTGTGLNDILEGLEGNDVLVGAVGDDEMVGGTGDDVYIVADMGDVVTELEGGGTADEVRTGLATYVLAANVEILTATNGSNHDFRGNTGDNIITTLSGADFLRLQDGGNDTASSGGGNDTIYAGAALTAGDHIDGGIGNDTLALQGSYGPGFRFGSGLVSNIVGIENIALLSGANALLGDLVNNRYDYHFTMLDSNVAAGTQLRINGGNLLAGEDLTVDGSAETDGSFVIYGGKGIDLLTGGAGNDVFFFAHDGRLGAGDHIDGGAGIDGLFIRGNFTVDFNDAAYFELIRNVENITLTSVTDTRYARSNDTEFDYDIITDDGMAAAGTTLTINGGFLQANETMKVDAHHESDAFLRIFAGASDDTIIAGALADTVYGGLGADILKGNGGNDTFRYNSHNESTTASRDHILDLTSGDKIDLSRIDAKSGGTANDAFSFIGSGAFTGAEGQLRAENMSGNDWLIQADRDGDGIADMEILVTTGDAHLVAAGDFVL